MIIRAYNPDEAEALAKIYQDAVLVLGPAAYTQKEVTAWASYADDRDAFARNLATGYTQVAEINGRPAAFCQLRPENHVALLYTGPNFARQGLASAVYLAIEEHARALGQPFLTTDASKISRPFFEHHGFTLRRTEQAFYAGVYFERFQMQKLLDSHGNTVAPEQSH